MEEKKCRIQNNLKKKIYIYSMIEYNSAQQTRVTLLVATYKNKECALELN